MAQLVLSPGALDGTVRPALLTFAGLAVLAGIALLNQAFHGEAPPLDSVPTASIKASQVGELTKQRTGHYATQPVSHGNVVVINAYDGVPDAARPAATFVAGAGTVLRVDDLVDVSSLPEPDEAQPWTVAVLDQRVVHIADAQGKPLTSYEDFAAARHLQAVHMVWMGLACLVLAPLLAFGTRILARFRAQSTRQVTEPRAD